MTGEVVILSTVVVGTTTSGEVSRVILMTFVIIRVGVMSPVTLSGEATSVTRADGGRSVRLLVRFLATDDMEMRSP